MTAPVGLNLDIFQTMNKPNQDGNRQPNNILHGITLEMLVTRLVEHYGWNELGRMISIKCFTQEPSIKSSLKFLRKTPWARAKVESLYRNTRALTDSAEGPGKMEGIRPD